MDIGEFTDEKLNSTEASDALIALGREGVLKGVHGVTSTGPLTGRVLPVRVSKNPSEGVSLRRGIARAAANATKDTILVITTDAEDYSAFGGFVSYIAKKAGIRAAVVCGNIRDVGEMEEIDFPAFSLSVTPLARPGEIRVASIGEQGEFNGVKINRDDLVVADRDGVTVVPKALVKEVVESIKKAREKEERDKENVEDLLKEETIKG